MYKNVTYIILKNDNCKLNTKEAFDCILYCEHVFCATEK
jgi:hypothetical protein